MFYLRKIKNEIEYSTAFKLVLSIFNPHNLSSINLNIYNQWNRYKNKDYNNIFILTDDIIVIGVVRLIPNYMEFKKIIYRVVGLSSICIHEKHRNKGYASFMMKAITSQTDKRNFDLSYLIARRQVDFFYIKFGFFGASSYNQTIINSVSNIKVNDKEVVNKFNLENIKKYNKYYNVCYKHCFGKTKRNHNYWNNIKNIISDDKDYIFKEFTYDCSLIGYEISYKNEIVEVAFDIKKQLNFFVSFFNKKQFPLKLNIPLNHKLNLFIDQLDVTYTSRRCSYGGHMIRWNKNNNINKILLSIGRPSLNIKEISPFFNIGKLDEI